MKLLPHYSLEAELSGAPFGPTYAAALSLELALTEAHRRGAGAHPAERELAVLGVQFPAIFQPIQGADLVAGRVFYPAVSFGPEPAGLGFVCREEDVRSIAARHALPPERLSQVEAMLEYWRTRTTAAKTRAAYPPLVARTLPSDAWTKDSGIAFPLYRMAGTVLDYAKLLRLGLPGLRAEAEARLARLRPEDDAGFLRGLLGFYDLFASCCAHYATQARSQALDCAVPARREELMRIARSLDALPRRAPESFHEALQCVWLYALLSGTWNYGRADTYLGPFLARDLDSGRLTEAEALRLVQCWWRLMKAYANQYNNRVFIGGRGRGDAAAEAAADRFALIAMEATRTVNLNEPQLSLRFYQGQNPALMEKALTVIGEGATFPMLYNDDVNIPAVAHAFRVPESEAVHYHPFGCGEYILATRSVGTPNGVINLAKCVEAALHGGRDPWGGAITGPATGEIESFRSFEDLWGAYAAQVEHHVHALALQEKIEYEVTGADAPFLGLSSLYDDCLSRGKPIFAGGVRYLGGTIETYGNTNAADSLHAIDEVVFRRRLATLEEVVAACDANFEGPAHERIRRLLLSVPKYGNDDTGADAMARRVHDHVCHASRDEADKVGLHSYLVVIINNWANVIFGETTHATPEGRRSREALANANNPSSGFDRNGVTAFLNSLVKLDPCIHAGAVQNMKFSREFFTRSRAKLEALLDGYWASGGTQAMITVVSPDDLRAAMVEPEKWGHLMVRVGGFSSRFIDLPRGCQEEVLRRTCHE